MTPLVIITAAVAAAATAPAMGLVAIPAFIVGLLAGALIGVPVASLGLRLGVRRAWQAVALGGVAAFASPAIGVLIAWPLAVSDPVDGQTLLGVLRSIFLSITPLIVVSIGMASACVFWVFYVAGDDRTTRRRRTIAFVAVALAAATILAAVKVEQRGARRLNAELAAARAR